MPDAPHKIAAVKFGFSDRTYDYLLPDDLDVEPGAKVIVETRRGEATVEVVEIKAESDRAEKFILRIAEPKPEQVP